MQLAAETLFVFDAGSFFIRISKRQFQFELELPRRRSRRGDQPALPTSPVLEKTVRWLGIERFE
jgi:hypothetical protein